MTREQAMKEFYCNELQCVDTPVLSETGYRYCIDEIYDSLDKMKSCIGCKFESLLINKEMDIIPESCLQCSRFYNDGFKDK